MRDIEDGAEFLAAVRRAFSRLTHEELPAAAAARGWPVRTPEEFERLLLDHLRDRRDDSSPPGGSPCMVDMILAVELGERLLAGNLCCFRMNRRQRCESASGDPRRADALKALFEMLSEPRRDPRPS